MLIRPPESLPRQTAPRRIAVRVKQKAMPAIRSGHPWLFEDSVKKAPPDAAPGDVAVLYDPDGKKILGAGLCDPRSQLRVRILQKDTSQLPVGSALFAKLAADAAAVRADGIPPETTAFRLANGESDGFPGLVADRYADTLVVKLYSEAFVPWAGDVADAFFAANPGLVHCVIRLSRALEDSPFVRQFFPEPAVVFTAKPAAFANPVRFQENGLVFEADVIRGQKTGFFLDQRDNRARVGTMSAGRDVLNVFSFSGGFSLYAARGGATSVCSVDADKHAIAACTRHFELNSTHPNVRRCNHEGIVGDAFEVMHDLARAKRRFGLVIVDPPSFAKSSAEHDRALHSYARLAALADSLLKPGGTLVFASCSSRVSAADFFPTVLGHTHVRELARTGHTADHPALFPESHYLKCLYAEKTVMSEHFPAELLGQLPGRLVPWFLRSKRDLEWRNDPTPYRVWVSEIMLQQTRVEAVKPYYDRFLSELPDVAALAAADEARLFKLWEGLGYYRRARNLQSAAKKIVQEHGGVFPSDYDGVRGLPGIGDYTAGAILSIAFGKPFPAVDGNVLRVVSRLAASREDIDSPKIRRELTGALAAVYPAGQCSEFTQSLMELGATVCLPNGAPLCAVCPLAGICLASKNGLTDEIPVRKVKATRPVKEFAVVVLRDRGGRFAVRRRPETGLLAGLYEFPNLEGRPGETALKKAFRAVRIEKSGTARHVFTHVEWDMTLYLAETDNPPDGFEWVTRDGLRSETAIPSAFKAALNLALDPDSFPGGKP